MKFVLPVIKLEMIKGRMSIFSILIRISPGKAITMTMLSSIGEATRSSIPETAPKITPMMGKRAFLLLENTPEHTLNVYRNMWPNAIPNK